MKHKKLTGYTAGSKGEKRFFGPVTKKKLTGEPNEKGCKTQGPKTPQTTNPPNNWGGVAGEGVNWGGGGQNLGHLKKKNKTKQKNPRWGGVGGGGELKKKTKKNTWDQTV